MHPSCGTNSGYTLHSRRKETPCIPCREAGRLYRLEQYAKNKARYIEQSKKWKQDNPERAAEVRAQWLAENAERVRGYKRRWEKDNPEYARLRNHKRRARMRDNGHEPYTETEVLDKYGTDCHLCAEPVDLEAPRSTRHAGWERGLQIDHLIPLAAGGPDNLENVRPSHGLCNVRRGVVNDSQFSQFAS